MLKVPKIVARWPRVSYARDANWVDHLTLSSEEKKKVKVLINANKFHIFPF